MGAGLSLSERQIEEIIKRDMKVDLAKQRSLPCSAPYLAYRNMLLAEHAKSAENQLNRFIDKRIITENGGEPEAFKR